VNNAVLKTLMAKRMIWHRYPLLHFICRKSAPVGGKCKKRMFV